MRQSRVLFRAWAIKKATPSFTFRKALLVSWRTEKLKMQMEGGNIVQFVYVKNDGSIRIAEGTIPTDYVSANNDSVKTYGQHSVVNYFDTVANGWR
jgi:hypothetical protein